MEMAKCILNKYCTTKLDGLRCFNFLFFFLPLSFQAQFSLAGTYDGYAALSKKGISHLPFMVSHSKVGTYEINLLEIELGYTKNHFRFQFSPAIGAYMQRNYAAETPLRRFVYESYLQYEQSKCTIAFGTFSSPYTQETPRGVDQLSATRSLAAEYVPYYVSGLRWTQQWKPNFKTQFFLTNAWQRLAFSRVRPSLGLLLQWECKKLKLNWSHFYGDLAPVGKPTPELGLNRWRFFQEFNVGYSTNKWTFQSCAYAGLQKQNGESQLKYWGQANLQAAFALNPALNLVGRAELFYDPQQVVFAADSGAFTSFSAGWMQRVGPALQVGQEFRYFLSKQTNIPVLYSFLRLKF